MAILTALLFAILAGAINGSFVAPINYIKTSPIKVWFYFSFWGFVIVPLATFFLVDPQFYHLLFQVPLEAVLVPLVAGFIWGVGMICLSIALKYIGIAVAFVINIGIATAGGALIPLIFFPQQAVSALFMFLIVTAVVFLLAGVLYAGVAANQREKERRHNMQANSTHKTAMLAVLITVFAGISSAFQGAGYAYALSYYEALAPMMNKTFILAILPWFFVFLGGFTPYMLYFAILNIKRKDQQERLTLKSHLLISLMAIMFFESTVSYAKASAILGALGPIIAWPLFMIFIILVSNLWGVKYKEWQGASKASKAKMIFAIGLLILAIIILVTASIYR